MQIFSSFKTSVVKSDFAAACPSSAPYSQLARLQQQQQQGLSTPLQNSQVRRVGFMVVDLRGGQLRPSCFPSIRLPGTVFRTYALGKFLTF